MKRGHLRANLAARSTEAPHPPSPDCRAFTSTELAFAFAAAVLITLAALPLRGNTKLRSDRLVCGNNLRQIGVAFQVWSDAHEDYVPWMVPQQSGGTAITGSSLMDLAWYHFLPLSNSLPSPSVLSCPSDATITATNWSQAASGGFINPAFRNNAVSYLVGCHAELAVPSSTLSADRNVQYDAAPVSCSLRFRAAVQLFTHTPGTILGWKTTNMHAGFGNLLTISGNVSELSTAGLRKFLRSTSDNGSEHYLLPR